MADIKCLETIKINSDMICHISIPGRMLFLHWFPRNVALRSEARPLAFTLSLCLCRPVLLLSICVCMCPHVCCMRVPVYSWVSVGIFLPSSLCGGLHPAWIRSIISVYSSWILFNLQASHAPPPFLTLELRPHTSLLLWLQPAPL